MALITEVKDMEKFIKAVNIPEELHIKLLKCDKEEVFGEVSAFCVKSGHTWKYLRELLVEIDENRAVEVISLMEQYICAGLSIPSETAYK